MEQLTVGIIGCGIAAVREILPGLVREGPNQALRVVAVCDREPARAAATAARFGIPAWYGDHRELLADRGTDLVVVATPIPTHAPVALEAIAAGKHVCVQKTLAVTAAEATLVIEAARARGVKLVASPGTHLADAGPYAGALMNKVAEWIGAGLLGTLAYGRSSMHTRHEDEEGRGPGAEDGPPPHWYYQPGGGPMRDLMVYALHAVTWCLGPVKAVVAVSRTVLPERQWEGEPVSVREDDYATIIATFNSGVHVCFMTSFVSGWSIGHDLEIVGSDGFVLVKGLAAELWTRTAKRSYYGYEYERRCQVECPPRPVGWHVFTDIVHLAECVRSGAAPALRANTPGMSSR